MDGAAGVLVIILSVFLAVFLILAIYLLILLIKISRQIKTVTSSAQRAAEGIESTVQNLSAASTPLAVAKMIKKIIKVSKNKR